ncbi:MAG: hypothetical protein NC308_11580 [Clostridium sp.]|nr:hypothetical protein [Bacteroides sp.]MCM1199518.1 hypothetical protein [Clostridium sp.]
MKRLVVTFIVMVLPMAIYAQGVTVLYDYDSAGNRVSRNCMTSVSLEHDAETSFSCLFGKSSGGGRISG